MTLWNKRRPYHFYKYLILIVVLFLGSHLYPSLSRARLNDGRTLSFYHTHTGERLQVAYYRDGAYQQDVLEAVNQFLSDFRTGDIKNISPAALDIVYDVQGVVGNRGEVHIVSAYRSPKTNEMLRSQGRAVAKYSQHVEGNAIDFRLPGTSTSALRDAARQLGRGGVGYYAKSDFVHVDVGRVRYW